MPTVQVDLARRSYPVIVGQGLLVEIETILVEHSLSANRIAVISDHNS